MATHPDISSLNGALSQITPAAYMQRGSFRVLRRTEQNTDFITVSMFSQNSVKFLLQRPFQTLKQLDIITKVRASYATISFPNFYRHCLYYLLS